MLLHTYKESKMGVEIIPDVSQNNGFWEGTIHLDFWNAFFDISEDIKLNIGGDRLIGEITAFHKKGYEYLIENQKKILDSILSDLMNVYPQMQNEYDYDEIEKAGYMPNVSSPESFKNILKPDKIYILEVSKDKIPYIGCEFICSWDDEHGLGVMLYKDKVIQMGGADTSFLSWIAEKDLNK
jgi:hypothetical protein